MSEIIIQPLQSPFLKLASSEQGFALHRAALEWDIQEPIVIEGSDDVKSEASWRNSLTPFHHQVRNLITFCRRLPVTLLADDVGLGKTISAGLVLSELMSRKRVNKALVICPKILMPQWQEELKSKFSIESFYASGRAELNDAIKLFNENDRQILITTYASARSHLDMLEKVGFQMLILDEAHKLRNLYGTEKAPKTAIRIRKALTERTFKYVLMLTATPIHNRLWDLYSLIDLMTVAKGHQNPFGTEEQFVRRFSEDGQQARKINLEHKAEFRSIVYDYMSRVRRTDAKLSFPVRHVKSRWVPPSQTELQLIKVVGQKILKLNKLAQISLLKALVSSPQALISQLKHMVENGTMPAEPVSEIFEAAKEIGTTSKLHDLKEIIDQLCKDRPADWRVVIFTQLIETQKAICEFLDFIGIKYGTISGESGRRNQETIKRVSCNPPEINVVVSTEAGAEGVNLQAANVLINYDLPWNPMIVEQRIGRIQRLGSQHANVLIFNTVLKGTFEEKIVGRLMEKLQMAANAIGDIDSLLEAAGMDDENEETSFEEIIRQLVIASLEGKDVQEDTRLKMENISHAKIEMDQEEENINTLLGGEADQLKNGPRAPKMSSPAHSMSVRDFVLMALKLSGSTLLEEANGIFVDKDTSERIAFVEDLPEPESAVFPNIYAPGRPRFDRLIGKFISLHECLIDGLDVQPRNDIDSICKDWANSFRGKVTGIDQVGMIRQFSGKALLRARINVAHDSFEKVIEIDCTPKTALVDKSKFDPQRIDPAKLGIEKDRLIEAVTGDPDVNEFCRFYLERREEEIKAAGDDEKKRAKLSDDFTPRLTPSLVGLIGNVSSKIQLDVNYQVDEKANYSSSLQIDAKTGALIHFPAMETCQVTMQQLPSDCISRCQISKKSVSKHLLTKSEISDLLFLPEHGVVCAISHKRVASSEASVSDVTGKPAIRSLLKTSMVSGKLAEPALFGKCEFSDNEVLMSELTVSGVSSKKFRSDQESFSTISGKKGHQSEFIVCSETGKSLLPSEGEKCDVTGKFVSPGVLRPCEASGKRVIPSILKACSVSGKQVLFEHLVQSSVSNKDVLKSIAVKSRLEKFCLPAEAIVCTWDGYFHHPEDVAFCSLTGVSVCRENLIGSPEILKHLMNVLEGPENEMNVLGDQDLILGALEKILGKGKYRICKRLASSSGYATAISVESSAWLGLKKRILGFIFLPQKMQIAGKVAIGRLEGGKWKPEVSMQ